jgi:ApaG protein
MIYSITTHNITVSVEAQYEYEASRPAERKYIFIYYVKITNNGKDTVQLLSRRWSIKNIENSIKVIEGDGVIGEQPILEPGQSHQYRSWSIIATPIGLMTGKYKMVNLTTQKEFWVDIPEFDLVTPFKLN